MVITTVRPIRASETHPLRQSVLRPGWPAADLIFAGDELPTTTHWGAFTPEGELAAIATFRVTPKPGSQEPAWQLRGMASLPELRGQGYGAAALKAGIDWLRNQAPGALLWCNAREKAVGFYLKYGFVVEGDVFEIEKVGPHFLMWTRIAQ